MPRRLHRSCLGLLLAVALAGPAAADDEVSEGQHCQGEARTKLLMVEGLFVQTAPVGVENQLQAGVCTPLIRKPGVLFDHTNLQAGVTVNAAPVYAFPGVFVSIAPLSILELRAEAAPFWTWPIGMDGAGYFPRSSADEQFKDLPGELAESARGLTATFTGTLQAEVELWQGFTVAAVNSLSYAYWDVGDAPFYYHPRYDLVMERQDWLGRNMALVLAGRRLSPRLLVRAGLTDEYTWSQRTGNRQNILAGVVTAEIAGWPRSGDLLQPFLRVGGFTEHAFRSDLAVLGGVAMTLDVTRGRGR